MDVFNSFNPYNNFPLGQQFLDNTEIVATKIQQAYLSFEIWHQVPNADKGFLVKKLGEILIIQRERLAEIITQEMGKILVESRAEIDKCAQLCHYYASHFQEMLVAETTMIDDFKFTTSYQPLGTVLGVMPWNFPFWQVFRFAIPTLLAGNTVVVKHAHNVSMCAKAIESLFIEAGFVQHQYQNIFVKSDQLEAIIANPIIKAVSLTGSEAAGKSVAALCGKYLKKNLLELGSNDVFIVLKDCDLQKAVAAALKSRMINNGQSCIAAKRFIVEESVYDAFVAAYKKLCNELVMGDPMLETTQVGPMARKDLKDGLQKQIDQSVAQGARYSVLNSFVSQDDSFMAPAILEDIPQNCPAYNEELFGPVAALFKVSNYSEALELANDSNYGLGASIWCNNKEIIDKLILELEVGCIFVNGLVASHPAMPFGGVKNSGYGRELGSLGIKEFVNIKSIVINE